MVGSGVEVTDRTMLVAVKTVVAVAVFNAGWAGWLGASGAQAEPRLNVSIAILKNIKKRLIIWLAEPFCKTNNSSQG